MLYCYNLFLFKLISKLKTFNLKKYKQKIFFSSKQLSLLNLQLNFLQVILVFKIENTCVLPKTNQQFLKTFLIRILICVVLTCYITFITIIIFFYTFPKPFSKNSKYRNCNFKKYQEHRNGVQNKLAKPMILPIDLD